MRRCYVINILFYRDVVFCSTLASRGLTHTNYGPHTYVYMSDRWGERNGTGYWMVGPVDDLSDQVFLEESSLDLDTMISTYTPTRHFEQIMRGFCLKKIYPGINYYTDCISQNHILGPSSCIVYSLILNRKKYLHSCSPQG